MANLWYMNQIKVIRKTLTAHCPLFSVALEEGKLCHMKKKPAHNIWSVKVCSATHWLGYF